MRKRRQPHPETCEKCPHRYSEAGCPAWVGREAGFFETNEQTGEERLVTGCFYQVMPKLMVHVVRASNRPAAAVEGCRNEIRDGLTQVANLAAQGAFTGPPVAARELLTDESEDP